jgi:hypothetical protein
MLRVACRNSGNCLALGEYDIMVKEFFEQFRNMNYIVNTLTKRISAGTNGVVLGIPFTKNGYTAHTVLKVSSDPTSDNLFYEYYVGKFFINKYIHILPCFVETYDYYLFKNRDVWAVSVNAANSGNFHKVPISKCITRKEIKETDYTNFTQSCKDKALGCILIQHFDRFQSLYSYAHNENFDVCTSLFQIYFGLNCLYNIYTHYDLHAGNVGLYKPYAGKQYILMRYHIVPSKRVYMYGGEKDKGEGEKKKGEGEKDKGEGEKDKGEGEKDKGTPTSPGFFGSMSPDTNQNPSSSAQVDTATNVPALTPPVPVPAPSAPPMSVPPSPPVPASVPNNPNISQAMSVSAEEVIEFKTEYIAKIIDYGRNYFNNKPQPTDATNQINSTNPTNTNAGISTDEIINNYIKGRAECVPDCGADVGYSIIQGTACGGNAKFYWIDPNKPNMSHDMTCYYNILQMKYYTDLTPPYFLSQYGTPYRPSDGTHINNISDLLVNLKQLMNIPHLNGSLKYDSTWTHAATMDVYSDGQPYTLEIMPGP